MHWPTVAQLIRLPSQSGTLLLMLPTFWALVLASSGHPPVRLVAVFAAGAFLMRSAGVVLNDLADRTFDRQIGRTRTRPLASGSMEVSGALAVAAALLLLAACLLVFLNWLTILLSPVAVLLAALYPFSKRFLDVPQAILGAAFGWGTVMAWAAVRDTLDHPVWLLFAATVFWAIAYDSIYALQDRDDDARIGVKSSALFFGSWTWLAVAVSFGTMVTCLGACGYVMGLGLWFYMLLGAVTVFLALQIRRLRTAVSPGTAMNMFKQHVWVGWTILGGLWLGFL